jgi:hypothetical protein
MIDILETSFKGPQFRKLIRRLVGEKQSKASRHSRKEIVVLAFNRDHRLNG